MELYAPLNPSLMSRETGPESGMPGTTKFTWYSPAKVGASPEKLTTACCPSTNMSMVSFVVLNVLTDAPTPSATAGVTAPSPVPNSWIVSPTVEHDKRHH